MRYIGFDIGDGESAIAVFQQGSVIEPVMQAVGGNKSFISAVGKVHGEIVIGEQAYTDGLAEELSVRFKSRFTYDPASHDTIVLFAKGVMQALKEADALKADDVFSVGCPAGWNAAEKERYRDLFVRAGVPNPRIVSESRAAFLYAKYAKTVALDIDVFQENALVIDIGSSTMDFAYIVNGRETEVETFGETRLGGGLLDEELLRRAIEKSKGADNIRKIFAESKSWYSYSEIEARKVKEEYFARGEIDPNISIKKQLRIRYDGLEKLDVVMNASEAFGLVDDPLSALQGKSFGEALKTVLEEACELTLGNPPQVVLLTGGASRMRFFQELCRDVFHDALVVSCPEPEFSIAKGLAYAGWMDENLRKFRVSVEKEMTDEKVAGVARDALPDLRPGIVNAIVDLVLEEVAIPAAAKWKSGSTKTLEEMSREMQRRAKKILQSPLAADAVSPAVQDWLKGLNGTLQRMIDPICDRYQVPRKEMQMAFISTGEAEALSIGVESFMGFSMMKAVTSVILSMLGGVLGGGGGVALITGGPIGFLAGAAMGAVLTLLGWPAVSDFLMKSKWPVPFRWLNLEKQLRSESAKKGLREAVMREIGNENSAFSKQIVAGFTDAFQKYLYQMTQAAEIPIQ